MEQTSVQEIQKCELAGDDDAALTENGTKFSIPENVLGLQFK